MPFCPTKMFSADQRLVKHILPGEQPNVQLNYIFCCNYHLQTSLERLFYSIFNSLLYFSLNLMSCLVSLQNIWKKQTHIYQLLLCFNSNSYFHHYAARLTYLLYCFIKKKYIKLDLKMILVSTNLGIERKIKAEGLNWTV